MAALASASVTVREKLEDCQNAHDAARLFEQYGESIQAAVLDSFEALTFFYEKAITLGVEDTFLQKFVFPQHAYALVQKIGDFPDYYETMRQFLFKGALNGVYPPDEDCSCWLYKFADKMDTQSAELIVGMANEPDLVAMAVEEALRKKDERMVDLLVRTKSDTIFKSHEVHLVTILEGLLTHKFFELFQILADQRPNEALVQKALSLAFALASKTDNAETTAFIQRELIDGETRRSCKQALALNHQHGS